MSLTMSAFALLEDVAHATWREQTIRDRQDLLANDDDRLLERNTKRSNVLPAPIQVLTTLGFLATGTFQRELADRSGSTQSTLNRTMPAVWDGSRYIKFPYNAVNQADIKTQFADTLQWRRHLTRKMFTSTVSILIPSIHRSSVMQLLHPGQQHGGKPTSSWWLALWWVRSSLIVLIRIPWRALRACASYLNTITSVSLF